MAMARRRSRQLQETHLYAALVEAVVLVYIRHHWIENHPLAATELPAWGPPAMFQRAWAVWKTVASLRHVRIVL